MKEMCLFFFVFFVCYRLGYLFGFICLYFHIFVCFCHMETRNFTDRSANVCSARFVRFSFVVLYFLVCGCTGIFLFVFFVCGCCTAIVCHFPRNFPCVCVFHFLFSFAWAGRGCCDVVML